jgi:hypothetical protein
MAHIVIEDGKPVIRDDWHIEDIHEAAETMELTLTDDQAVEAMHWVVKCFDAEIGINWYSIYAAIERVTDAKQ